MGKKASTYYYDEGEEATDSGPRDGKNAQN